MKKILLAVCLVFFAYQPVLGCAAQLPDALNPTITGGYENLVEKPAKWVQTANLVNGLYQIVAKIPEDGFYYTSDIPFVVDSFYILGTEGTSYLVDNHLNIEPVTQPDEIVGLFYFDQDTWVKVDLPCKFTKE